MLCKIIAEKIKRMLKEEATEVKTKNRIISSLCPEHRHWRASEGTRERVRAARKEEEEEGSAEKLTPLVASS